MQRNTEDIWKSVRNKQAITITEAMGVHFRLQGDTQSNNPWPRTYAIPEPPFHLNEIAWADYVHGKTCPYCPSLHGTQYPGTYHRACENCHQQYSRNIQQIKLDYEDDKTVDIRLYSILPYTALYGRKQRKFWRPICDASRRQMALYKHEVEHDERAIKTYVETGRILVKQLTEAIDTDVGLERRLSVWEQASDIVHEKNLKDRVERNTQMFLHMMRDTHYEPADLIEFCQHGPIHVGWDRRSPYPSWLTADAIIFDHAAAKSAVDNNLERLEKIREFRLVHEAYIAQEPVRARILKLFDRSLQQSNGGECAWGSGIDDAGMTMLCANHLPDILQLPPIKAIMDEMNLGIHHKRIQEHWQQTWRSIQWEAGRLQSQWQEDIAKLVRGPLQSQYPSQVNIEEQVFACSECERSYLFYPDVLSHSCFKSFCGSSTLA